MIRRAGAVVLSFLAVLFLGSASPAKGPWIEAESVVLFENWQPLTAPAAKQGEALASEPLPQPEPPPRSETLEALEGGVLIVVSKPSQQMFVFKDGHEWGASPVSTGKKGHATPAGVFPILQKKVHHRSNLYSNAPMPYMQRLTWSGIALHAGHLPGYPASHGCIRMPRDFAKELYAITDFKSTRVLVTDENIGSAVEARIAAGAGPMWLAKALAQAQTQALAPARRSIPGRSGPSQTIQLAAARSSEEAAALWRQLTRRRPALDRLDPKIIPAIVRSRKYYRLRASGAGAHALCNSLARAGEDCFNVRN